MEQNKTGIASLIHEARWGGILEWIFDGTRINVFRGSKLQDGPLMISLAAEAQHLMYIVTVTNEAYSNSKTVKPTREESPNCEWTPIFIIITHSLDPRGTTHFSYILKQMLLMILMQSFEHLMGCLESKRQGRAITTHLWREDILCLISPEIKGMRDCVRMSHKKGS